MNNVFLKPRQVDGQPVLVRDPQSGKPLDAGGEWKPLTQFWSRRLAQGDVVDGTAEQNKKQAAASAAAAQALEPPPPPSPAAPASFEPGPSLRTAPAPAPKK